MVALQQLIAAAATDGGRQSGSCQALPEAAAECAPPISVMRHAFAGQAVLNAAMRALLTSAGTSLTKA